VVGLPAGEGDLKRKDYYRRIYCLVGNRHPRKCERLAEDDDSLFKGLFAWRLGRPARERGLFGFTSTTPIAHTKSANVAWLPSEVFLRSNRKSDQSGDEFRFSVNRLLN